MKSKIARKMMEEMPEDIKLFTGIYAELTLKISEALKSKGMTQKDLAEQMNKRPSEISKWLKGEHNFTLRSLCKLQAELGVKLIEVPKEIPNVRTLNFTGKETFNFGIKNTKIIPLHRKKTEIEFTEKFTAAQ